MNKQINPSDTLTAINNRTNLTANDVRKDFAMQTIIKILSAKEERPDLKLSEVYKANNLSESKVARIRRDVGMGPINQYLIPKITGKGKGKKEMDTITETSKDYLCDKCDHKQFKTAPALKTHQTKMHKPKLNKTKDEDKVGKGKDKELPSS